MSALPYGVNALRTLLLEKPVGTSASQRARSGAMPTAYVGRVRAPAEVHVRVREQYDGDARGGELLEEHLPVVAGQAAERGHVAERDPTLVATLEGGARR